MPQRVTSTPSRSAGVRSTAWPIAATTVLHSIAYSEPAIGTGRRRPEASGSPSSMRWQVSSSTPAQQVPGRGQSGRPGANDADGFAARLGARRHERLRGGLIAIGGVAVERGDRQVLVVIAAPATVLAQPRARRRVS